MSPTRSFSLLTADAVSDALRNRVGLFALAFALCIGLFADRCTGFDAGTLMINGRELDVRDGARLVGPLVFSICTLLLVSIAGFLACDALSRPLAEGETALCLARPVGRGAYALSRLCGALGLALASGGVVLGVVGLLLHLRLGLRLEPALMGIGVFVLDAWVVAAVGMTLGLLLPRVVALMAVVIGLQLVVFSNGLHAVATSSSGLLDGIERWGPPLGTGVLYAVAPWFSPGASTAEWLDVGLRLVLWAAGASALLVVLFQRRDVPS